MKNNTRIGLISIALLGIILLLLPLFVESIYWIRFLMMLGINVLLAVTIRFIMLAGVLSLCHASFMGIGAYVSALLVMGLQFNTWLAMFCAGIFVALVAAAIGIPSLRLRGVYFLTVTFCLSEVLRLTFNSLWKPVLGGSVGLVGIPAFDPIFGITFEIGGTVYAFYYVLVALLLITCIILYYLERSHFGRCLKGIRESKDLAESVGVKVAAYKIFAFMIASFFIALVGSFWANWICHVSPGDVSFWRSVEALAYVVVGGQASIAGPIIGALVLTYVSELVRGFGEYDTIAYGVMLVIFLLYMPSGLEGIFEAIRNNLANLVRRSKPKE